MPRPTPRALPALLLAGLAACGNVSGTVGTSGPTLSQQLELRLTVEDEVESATSALTLAHPGVPPAFGAPAGCPAASSTADGDGDGIPDDATYTYLNPPCSVTGLGGGDYAVTGTLRVQDPSGANSTAFNLTLTDLAWSFTDSAGTLTYTATRNGTRTRLGSANAASLAVDMEIVRERPNRVAATVNLVTTTSFTASVPGTVQADQPLPDGTLTIAGTLDWQRSSEQWSLAVATPVPLNYDADCTTTPQRIKAGKLTLSGTVRGELGVLTLTWSACGAPPSRSWTPGA